MSFFFVTNKGRGCFSSNLQSFLEVVKEYGGAEKYLTFIGFAGAELADLKEQFATKV